MFKIQRMWPKIVTTFPALLKSFPFCSIMNISFLANKEQACFDYPMVSEWQSTSQPMWLPAKLHHRLFLVALEPGPDIEQPILALKSHFILQPTKLAHQVCHFASSLFWHFVGRLGFSGGRACRCSFSVDLACWANLWARGVWRINTDTHTERDLCSATNTAARC